EAAADVVLEEAIGFRLLLAQVRQNPTQSRTLPPSERPPLLDEPREMDLEVPARAGVAGDVSKPPAQLLREIATEVWAEGALPAAQASKGDAEVVQGLMVRG